MTEWLRLPPEAPPLADASGPREEVVPRARGPFAAVSCLRAGLSFKILWQRNARDDKHACKKQRPE